MTTPSSPTFFERVFAKRVAPFSDVPGPEPSFPMGNASDFSGQQPWDVLERYAREHGLMSVFWVFGTPSVVLADPELIDQVLTTRKLDFYKGDPFKAQLPLLSEQHPFLANYPAWPEVARRSPMGMPSYEDWLGENVSVAAERAAATLDELVAKHDDTSLEAADLVRRVVFRMMCRMIVGIDISWDDYRHLAALGDIGSDRMSTPLPIAKTPWSLKYRRSFEGWRSLHMAEVRRARTEPLDGRIDMLAHAVRDGSELDDFGLAAEMASRYFGGMYSSSVGALNTLFCLSQHADVRSRLRDEVSPLFRDGPAYGREQLDACELLDSVVRESLRLYAPIPIFLRRSDPVREVELGPARLAPNTQVMLSPWASMRHPDVWDQSNSWRPERWTPDVKADNPYGSARLWPFGQGPRACSAASWALVLIKAVVAEVVANWEFEVGAGQEWQADMYFACACPKGWRWSLRRQSSARAV